MTGWIDLDHLLPHYDDDNQTAELGVFPHGTFTVSMRYLEEGSDGEESTVDVHELVDGAWKPIYTRAFYPEEDGEAFHDAADLRFGTLKDVIARGGGRESIAAFED